MKKLIRALFHEEEQEEVPPGFVFVLITVLIVALTSFVVGVATGYLLFSS
jgi:hypothetical protein